MNSTTSRLIGVATVIALHATAAAAQSEDRKGYVDLRVAGQTQSVTVASSSSFSLYGEPAATSASQTVGKGLAFDGGAGYRVWDHISIGVAVSMFSRSPAADITITIPDPVAFGAFTTLSASPQLAQSELGTHISVWSAVQLNDKIGVAVSGGPSFVHLKKDIASANVVNGAAQIAVETQSGTAAGAHGGADLSYRFTPWLSGSVFARYVAATVDLPAASVPVGGFQGGLGIRLRF